VLFNSYIFAVFFVVIYVAYRALGHRGQNWLLLAASYVFYGSWDWRFLSLLVFSTTVDYYAGIAMSATTSTRRRKAFLALSMTTNLTLLGVCKYYNFFVDQFVALFELFGVDLGAATLRIILPVGISFYTFQSMSYAIDVYRGEAKVARNFPDFALFVSFFPQLVAGPIERYADLMNQIARPRVITDRHYVEGVYHILIGLFKKVVIADNMSTIANAVFATNGADFTGPECFLGLVAFAFQIYRDFSGYSSMAPRHCLPAWLRLDVQLQDAVFRVVAERFLVALVYQSVDVAARLSLHSARRQSPRHRDDVSQLDADDGARRTLAWRGVDVRPLGSVSWRDLVSVSPV
jgi:alginate O-acetyltransferase complex protein AlgI